MTSISKLWKNLVSHAKLHILSNASVASLGLDTLAMETSMWILHGHSFFVAVDAHSKLPGGIMMSSTTSQKTTDALRLMFAHHGLSEQLVSDNAPQFISAEFSQFLKENQVKHICCALYHPTSNGLAERFVQTLKRALKAGEKDGKTLNH